MAAAMNIDRRKNDPFHAPQQGATLYKYLVLPMSLQAIIWRDTATQGASNRPLGFLRQHILEWPCSLKLWQSEDISGAKQ
jgi:hypothetical protein